MRRGVAGVALTALIALSAGLAEADDQHDRQRGGGPRGPMGSSYQMGMGISMVSSGMGCAYAMTGPGGVHAFAEMPPPDTDRDGIVSGSEAAEYFSGAFMAMDGDGDSSLTLEEFSTVHLGPGIHIAMHGGMPPGARRGDTLPETRRGGTPSWQERKEARYKEIDEDDDGEVTQEEFIAYGKKQFDESDRDKNSSITVWEFRSRRYF